MYERILVPLDGSKFAEQAFPPVVELARAFDSEVVLIEVCEPEESESGQACRLYIRNEAEKLRRSMEGSAANVSTVVLTGKPAEQILDYAQQNDINLIIMASHGRSGTMPWSLGSTVNKVVHRAGVPLIIVRVKEELAEAAKESLFNCILVPLDGSEGSATILPYVAEITEKLESEVVLLQVVEPGRQVHTIGGLNYVPYEDRDIKSMAERSRGYLETVSSRLADTKATTRCEVRVGSSAREIIKFAREEDCSLIAMSSHGHSRIEEWIHGSVTHHILQASNQSVWLVPSPGIHR